MGQSMQSAGVGGGGGSSGGGSSGGGSGVGTGASGGSSVGESGQGMNTQTGGQNSGGNVGGAFGIAQSIGGAVGDTVNRNMNNSLTGYANALQIDAQRTELRDANRQLKINADAIEAMGIREANEGRLRGDIMLSNIESAVVDSGSSTTGVDAIERMAKVQDRTEYNALGAIYERNVDASKVRYQRNLNKIKRAELGYNKKLNRISTLLNTDMTAMM